MICNGSINPPQQHYPTRTCIRLPKWYMKLPGPSGSMPFAVYDDIARSEPAGDGGIGAGWAHIEWTDHASGQSQPHGPNIHDLAWRRTNLFDPSKSLSALSTWARLSFMKLTLLAGLPPSISPPGCAILFKNSRLNSCTQADPSPPRHMRSCLTIMGGSSNISPRRKAAEPKSMAEGSARGRWQSLCVMKIMCVFIMKMRVLHIKHGFLKFHQ